MSPDNTLKAKSWLTIESITFFIVLVHKLQKDYGFKIKYKLKTPHQLNTFRAPVNFIGFIIKILYNRSITYITAYIERSLFIIHAIRKLSVSMAALK